MSSIALSLVRVVGWFHGGFCVWLLVECWFCSLLLPVFGTVRDGPARWPTTDQINRRCRGTEGLSRWLRACGGGGGASRTVTSRAKF